MRNIVRRLSRSCPSLLRTGAAMLILGAGAVWHGLVSQPVAARDVAALPPGIASTPSFQEDFDRLDLAGPGGDRGRWKTSYFFGAQSGPWAWNSRSLEGELQVYTDRDFAGTGTQPLGLDPFTLDDGRLVIAARRVDPDTAALLAGHGWYSGLLTTENSFAQTYGYFEIRARLPEGAGFWPAFWLLPSIADGGTELDVFEQTGGSDIFQSVHDARRRARTFTTRLAGATDGFHDYGALWTADRVTFYLDGRETAHIATPASMHAPMYLLVNLAVSGGGWAGKPEAGASGAEFVIDRIRVFPLTDR